jgi:hypothetical protein
MSWSSSSWNAVRGRTSVSVGSIAVAVAERGAPSSSDSSPKKSPGRSVAMIASSPSVEGSTILTAPWPRCAASRPVALVEDDLVAPEAAPAHAGDDECSMPIVGVLEQRAPGERFDGEGLVHLVLHYPCCAGTTMEVEQAVSQARTGADQLEEGRPIERDELAVWRRRSRSPCAARPTAARSRRRTRPPHPAQDTRRPRRIGRTWVTSTVAARR